MEGDLEHTAVSVSRNDKNRRKFGVLTAALPECMHKK
jgi:hypothetical protein